MGSWTTRLAMGSIGVCVATAFFLGADFGGTLAGEVRRVNALAAAIWSVPFAVYVVAVRSHLVSVAGGTVLNVVSALALVALFRDTHSTAAFGVATLPFVLTLGVVFVALLDALCREHARR